LAKKGREIKVYNYLFWFSDDCRDGSGGFRKDWVSVNSIQVKVGCDVKGRHLPLSNFQDFLSWPSWMVEPINIASSNVYIHIYIYIYIYIYI